MGYRETNKRSTTFFHSSVLSNSSSSQHSDPRLRSSSPVHKTPPCPVLRSCAIHEMGIYQPHVSTNPSTSDPSLETLIGRCCRVQGKGGNNEQSLVAEPGPRLASMIRQALPRKSLLQVICVGRAGRLAALGGMGARGGRGARRRWARWGRVSSSCSRRRGGSRGMGGIHLLRLELADRAARDGRGRR